LFFQAALLAGYLYAHLLATRGSPRWQVRIHIALLLASLLLLPIVPAVFWKPAGGENPLPLILGLLSTTIGLPFVLLSSTTPLVQAWLVRTDGAREPQNIYRLYALSNLGSMLALFSYPVLIEPYVATHWQAWIWSSSYGVFAVLCSVVAWNARAARPVANLDEDIAAAPAMADRVLWFLLPLTTSALLLATTDHILRNIAAIPLLWVIPLALYLLSFIVAFESPRWYSRPFWAVLFGIVTVPMIYGLSDLFLVEHFAAMAAFYSGGLFVCCMVCHGELAALKPGARHLTGYYLSISAGGAAGGLLIAAVAPALFDANADLLLVLPFTVALGIVAMWRQWGKSEDALWRWIALGFALAVLAIDTQAAGRDTWRDLTQARFLERNFYGALQVMDWGDIRVLQNGNVIHGREFQTAGKTGQPISYYAPESGLGRAIAFLEARGRVSVGAIGLGAGTIGGYARATDRYRFYEINPAVRAIALSQFHYLPSCGAQCDVTLGDARLSLESETPQHFDLLALDAFTGDSIPVHLLTREAFALYWRHLKPGGILAVHVSNKYIDLAPVVAAAARESGHTARLFLNRADDPRGVDASSWVLVAAPDTLAASNLGGAAIAIPPGLGLWTDDYSNLWRSLR
jgi:SAM-dependent methyltransferase